MVAPSDKQASILPLPFDWIATRSASQVWLTRADVDAMVRIGIVPEDATTELLHGVLLRTDRSKKGENLLSVGDDHSRCVELLSDLRSVINSPDQHVRSQQPLVCSDSHEPQPDFFILRGSIRQYTTKPTAADATCVVEVADSSYERDAGEKLFGYAQAGIAQYIIINLRNRTAEVYTRPDRVNGRYDDVAIIRDGGEVALATSNGTLVAVLAAVLP